MGRLRSLNSATIDGLAAINGASGIFGASKVSVKCSASYCHSNGYAANLQYAESPDWYGPAYSGDKCAMCHGNSPDSGGKSGSAAHSIHAVGIHYTDIFNGQSRKIASAGVNGVNAAHGAGNRSTTISCNICHNSTVTTSANDRNSSCSTASCHGTGGVSKGEAIIANSALHVNGLVDVSFKPVQIATKAQVKPAHFKAYTSAASGNWLRNNSSYKQYTSSFDYARIPLNTFTMWSSSAPGQGSCSNISCHNGAAVKWNDTLNCQHCHKAL